MPNMENIQLHPCFDEIIAEFESKLFPVTETGCWLWYGGMKAKGYGCFRMKAHGIKHLAHRSSWMIYNGNIPNDQCVLHRCDVRLCCNPDHLFLGDRKDNSDDMVSKNRQAKGEQNGSAKLTTEEVISILKDPRHQTEIAKDFNVSPAMVSWIKRGKKWRHISRESLVVAKNIQATGDSHHSSKLTEKQAASILNDPRTQKEVAEEFGISAAAVSKIQTGRTWKHLNRERSL